VIESPGPPQPAPAPPKQGMSSTAKIAIAVIVVIGVLIAGVGTLGFFTISAVASDHQATLKVLEQVRVDNNAIDQALNKKLSFSADSLSGANPDYAGFQQTVESYLAALGKATTTVDADLAKLRTQDSRIKSNESGPRGTFGRSEYEGDRTRVEAVIDSFDAAEGAFGILKTQFDFFDKYVGALNGFSKMVGQATAGDLSGSIAAYAGVAAALDTSSKAVSGPNMPPQFQSQVAGLKTFAQDFHAALVAAQAGNETAYNTAYAKLQSDQSALSFDEAAYEKFETDLLAPYRTRYENGLKKAGFQVVNS